MSPSRQALQVLTMCTVVGFFIGRIFHNSNDSLGTLLFLTFCALVVLDLVVAAIYFGVAVFMERRSADIEIAEQRWVYDHTRHIHALALTFAAGYAVIVAQDVYPDSWFLNGLALALIPAMFGIDLWRQRAQATLTASEAP